MTVAGVMEVLTHVVHRESQWAFPVVGQHGHVMVGRLRIVGRGSGIERAAQAEGLPVAHQRRAGNDRGFAGVVEGPTLVPFTPSSPRGQRIEELGELDPAHLRSLFLAPVHHARSSLVRRSAGHRGFNQQRASLDIASRCESYLGRCVTDPCDQWCDHRSRIFAHSPQGVRGIRALVLQAHEDEPEVGRRDPSDVQRTFATVVSAPSSRR